MINSIRVFSSAHFGVPAVAHPDFFFLGMIQLHEHQTPGMRGEVCVWHKSGCKKAEPSVSRAVGFSSVLKSTLGI